MVCVFAKNEVPTEKTEEFIAVARELVDATVKEDGCVTYEFCRKGNFYIFFERWESQSALDNHFKMPHFVKCVPAMEALRTSGETTVIDKLF